MLSNIITTLLHHLDLLIRECPRTVALEVLIELITESHMVVTACDEVCRSCVTYEADTAVVVDLSLTCATVLSVYENDTGRSLRTVDCTGRSILED